MFTALQWMHQHADADHGGDDGDLAFDWCWFHFILSVPLDRFRGSPPALSCPSTTRRRWLSTEAPALIKPELPSRGRV